MMWIMWIMVLGWMRDCRSSHLNAGLIGWIEDLGLIGFGLLHRPLGSSPFAKGNVRIPR